MELAQKLGDRRRVVAATGPGEGIAELVYPLPILALGQPVALFLVGAHHRPGPQGRGTVRCGGDAGPAGVIARHRLVQPESLVPPTAVLERDRAGELLTQPGPDPRRVG